jgi:hypothetical protein
MDESVPNERAESAPAQAAARLPSFLRTLLLSSGVFAVVGILSLAGARFFLARIPAYHTRSKSLVRPDHYTAAEEDAFMTALANGDPLPEGWKAEDEGEVTGKFTGVIDPFHLEGQIQVTLADQPEHIDSATLEVNGAVVASASRTVGTVVDEEGRAVVRMLAMLPLRGRREVALTWTSSTGVKRSSSVSLKR